MKLYDIVNNFTDKHTKKDYFKNKGPVLFDEERVKEILQTEIEIGYKLIKEHVEKPRTKKKDKKEDKNENNA